MWAVICLHLCQFIRKPLFCQGVQQPCSLISTFVIFAVSFLYLHLHQKSSKSMLLSRLVRAQERFAVAGITKPTKLCDVVKTHFNTGITKPKLCMKQRLIRVWAADICPVTSKCPVGRKSVLSVASSPHMPEVGGRTTPTL